MKGQKDRWLKKDGQIKTLEDRERVQNEVYFVLVIYNEQIGI